MPEPHRWKDPNIHFSLKCLRRFSCFSWKRRKKNEKVKKRKKKLSKEMRWMRNENLLLFVRKVNDLNAASLFSERERESEWVKKVVNYVRFVGIVPLQLHSCKRNNLNPYQFSLNVQWTPFSVSKSSNSFIIPNSKINESSLMRSIWFTVALLTLLGKWHFYFRLETFLWRISSSSPFGRFVSNLHRISFISIRMTMKRWTKMVRWLLPHQQLLWLSPISDLLCQFSVFFLNQVSPKKNIEKVNGIRWTYA